VILLQPGLESLGALEQGRAEVGLDGGFGGGHRMVRISDHRGRSFQAIVDGVSE
jgi:hypothetical protein